MCVRFGCCPGRRAVIPVWCNAASATAVFVAVCVCVCACQRGNDVLLCMGRKLGMCVRTLQHFLLLVQKRGRSGQIFAPGGEARVP